MGGLGTVLFILRGGDLRGTPLTQRFQIAAGCAIAAIVLFIIAELTTDDPTPDIADAARGHLTGAQRIRLSSDGG